MSKPGRLVQISPCRGEASDTLTNFQKGQSDHPAKGIDHGVVDRGGARRHKALMELGAQRVNNDEQETHPNPPWAKGSVRRGSKRAGREPRQDGVVGKM